MSSTSASSPPPAVIKADEESPTAAAVTVPSGGNSAEAALDDKAAITTDTTDSGFLRGKTFAQKLHTLLSITKYASIISWNVAGDVAIIHDVDAFNSTIMSVHFKKSKFGSFVRKLRRHGFSVISKQRSKSVTMMEFSSDYFLRDQPDLCHKMKDERKGQKQFSFLDPNVKIVIMNDGSVPITLLTPVVGGDGNIMGSPFGVGFHSSPSSSNMNVANYQVGCQQQLNTIGDGGFNAAANNGYLHINAYDNSKMSPMVSPPQNQQSFHNVMPMMNDNMMMPQQQQQQQQPPQLQHPLYGSSDAPSVQHQAPVGGGFAPSTPTPLFTYPPAPSEYPDLPQQLIGMQHNPQQQMEMQPNPQQQMFQSQQQHPQMMMTQHNLQQQQHQQLIQQNLQQMQQQMIRQSQQQQQHHSQQQMMQQMMQQNQQSLPPPPPAESGVSSGRDLATDFAAFIPIDECSNAKPSTAGVSNAVSFSNSEDSTERPPNNKVDLYSPKGKFINSEHHEIHVKCGIDSYVYVRPSDLLLEDSTKVYEMKR